MQVVYAAGIGAPDELADLGGDDREAHGAQDTGADADDHGKAGVGGGAGGADAHAAGQSRVGDVFDLNLAPDELGEDVGCQGGAAQSQHGVQHGQVAPLGRHHRAGEGGPEQPQNHAAQQAELVADLVRLGAGLAGKLLVRHGHNAQAEVSAEGVDGNGPAGVQETFKDAAFQQEPFIEDISDGKENAQHEVLVHFQPAQHRAHADEQAGGGKLGKQEAVDVHNLELPGQEALDQHIDGDGDAHSQEGGGEGGKLMAPQENHQEAEAYQKHSQDVDGSGVSNGVKNGAGGVVQAAGVNGSNGTQPFFYVGVDGREERHCHHHGDQQEDDQQSDISVGFHAVTLSSLSKKITQGTGAKGPLRDFIVAPYFFTVNYFM